MLRWNTIIFLKRLLKVLDINELTKISLSYIRRGLFLSKTEKQSFKVSGFSNKSIIITSKAINKALDILAMYSDMNKSLPIRFIHRSVSFHCRDFQRNGEFCSLYLVGKESVLLPDRFLFPYSRKDRYKDCPYRTYL